jgi:hypothetical protein
MNCPALVKQSCAAFPKAVVTDGAISTRVVAPE